MNTGPKEIAEIARAFQIVVGYIERHPNEMGKEGVFRKAADSKIPPEILQKIKKMKKKETDLDKDLKNQEIYSLLDALKLSLKGKVLIEPKDPSVVKLKAAIKAVDSRESASVQAGAKAIEDFIEELSNSEDLSKKAIAEIIHTYAHLAYIASQFEESNRMSRNNLAVTPIAPFLLNNFSLAPDALEMLALSDKMNACCAQMLANENYKVSYAEKRDKSKEHIEKRGSSEKEVLKRASSESEHEIGAHIEQIRIEQATIAKLEENVGALTKQFSDGNITEGVFQKMQKGLTADIEARRAKIEKLAKIEPDSPPFSQSSSRSASPLSARSTDISPAPTTRRDVMFRDPQDLTFQQALHAQAGNVKKTFKQLSTEGMSPDKIVLLFHRHVNALDREQQTQLAEYLCEKDNKGLLNTYMAEVPIMDRELAPAMKTFLENSIFRFLKEGQKLERYLDAFSAQYAVQNEATEFMKMLKEIVPAGKAGEAVSVAAVAMLMLNTDLHNPKVKDKMKKSEFLKQMKMGFSGIDVLVDKLDKQKQKEFEKMSGSIYDYIKKNEIKMKESASPEPAKASAHADVSPPLSPREISAAKSAMSAVESGRLGSIRRTHSFRQMDSQKTLKDQGGGSPEEAEKPESDTSDKSKRLR